MKNNFDTLRLKSYDNNLKYGKLNKIIKNSGKLLESDAINNCDSCKLDEVNKNICSKIMFSATSELISNNKIIQDGIEMFERTNFRSFRRIYFYY